MNNISDYDDELLDDISKLEHEVIEGERLGRSMMRGYGTKENVIEKVIRDARKEGKPFHWEYGSSKDFIEYKEWLETMVPFYKPFPFRIKFYRHFGLDMSLIFSSGIYTISDKSITLNEHEVLSRLEKQVHQFNLIGEYAHITNWYPTPELMSLLGNLIIKYEIWDICRDIKDDERSALQIGWNSIKQEIIQKCSIPRLEYIINKANLPAVDVDSVIANQDIDGLIEALDYSSYRFERNIIQSLVNIGKPTVDPLINALKDSRPILRENAIKTLGEISDTASAEPLVMLIKHEGPLIALDNALTKIGKPSVPFLIKLLRDENKSVRERVVEILGNIRDSTSIEPLVNLLGDNDVGFRLERSIEAFKELAVPFMIKSLSSKNTDVRKRASRILGNIKDKKATMPLCSLLKSKNKEDRVAALQALEKIGDPDAIDFVINAASDADESIRSLSAKVLGTVGDVRSLPILLKLLKKERSDRDIYQSIINVLNGTLAQGSEEIVGETLGELVILLGDNYLWSHASTILTVVRFPIVDILANTLKKTTNKEIRKRIPGILSSRVTRKLEDYNTSLQILRETLQDRDSDIRFYAELALGDLK